MRPDGETTIVYQKKQGYKMIRHYMMGDLLGEGQQGKVKEAIDSTSLRRVAIKIVNLRQLRKVCNGDSSAEEGVRRELSIHRKLKHPNVVELIEQFVLDEKQKLYAVLEYVPGGNLQDVTDELPDNVMPPRIASFLMRQLFVGLEYCHSQGVVHRDVKPSNVMVSTDGLLKITDFGVAEELQRYQDGDTTSKSRGSPAFQPPEVASGCQSFSGFKVDVWAAGVSLYLLMTGEVPFTGSSLINLFETIAKGEYIIPPRLQEQPELLSLVQGLLRVDHSSRLSVSEALNHPWLAEQERSQVWGHEERSVVQRTMHSLRSTAVLRAIARMYGEKFDDADDEGECTTVASAAFRSDGYDGLAAGSGPAGTSEIAARAGAHSSVVSSSKIAGEPAEKGVARVGKPVTAAEVNHANSASSASSCGVECHQGMDGGSESGPGKDGSQDCALS